MITEIWTKSDSFISLRELCPKGFSFYHIPRRDRLGGGVGLLERSNLKILKKIKSYSVFEYMETVLRSKKLVTRIVTVYRVHASTKNGITMSSFFDDFSELLVRLTVSSGLEINCFQISIFTLMTLRTMRELPSYY